MSQANQALNGKIVMITGATQGIGLATAQALAGTGATLILVGRNVEKGKSIASDLSLKSGNSNIVSMSADLSSQQALRELADQFKSRYKTLHVLINNAGGVFMSRTETVDGIEMTFALNHLSYFLLTHLLLDALKASTPARIINVSSEAQSGAKLNFNDLQLKTGYSGFRAYSQSKLENVMFTYELARRLAGTGVTANVLHPGAVRTGFGANNGGWMRLVLTLVGPFMKTPEQGADTSVYLASSPQVEGVTGQYFVNKKPKRSNPLSYDEAACKRLWTISEQMTGLA